MATINDFKKLPISIPEDGKYRIGLKSHKVVDVEKLKPKFAFDYVSVRRNVFCFNATHLGRNNYVGLINGLKEASKMTFKELEDSHTYHFHDIDFDEVSIKKSEFYKAILGKYDGEDYIIPYQMKVFKEERVIGFLYDGTFYLVMFDSGHNAYNRKKNPNEKRRKMK